MSPSSVLVESLYDPPSSVLVAYPIMCLVYMPSSVLVARRMRVCNDHELEFHQAFLGSDHHKLSLHASCRSEKSNRLTDFSVRGPSSSFAGLCSSASARPNHVKLSVYNVRMCVHHKKSWGDFKCHFLVFRARSDELYEYSPDRRQTKFLV